MQEKKDPESGCKTILHAIRPLYFALIGVVGGFFLMALAGFTGEAYLWILATIVIVITLLYVAIWLPKWANPQKKAQQKNQKDQAST